MDRKVLGQALLKNEKLTKDQLKNAMAMHDKIGGDFAALLVKLGYVSDEDVTSILGKLEGVETVDVSQMVIPKKLVESIPRHIIEKHHVIPISKKGDQITLAMAEVKNYEAIEEIQFLTGCKVEPVLASREAIRKAIIQFYYGEDELLEEKEEAKQDSSLKDLDEWISKRGTELQKVLISLLIEKNVFSKEELLGKLKEFSEPSNL